MAVEEFSTEIVRSIKFEGRDGNDNFLNRTAIKSTAYGGDGAAPLIGGQEADPLDAQAGNDHIVGNDGDDLLRAGDTA